MRATPAIGMNVCLKSQEKSANPVIMQIDGLDEKTNTAEVIGFTTQNQPFKVKMNLDNLEKVSNDRIKAMT